MTVTLRVTSKLFTFYDLQITILKIDSVNCKHVGRDVTHTSVKTTSAVCMARRLVTKSTI